MSTVFHPNFDKTLLEQSQTATRKGIDNSIPSALLENASRLSLWLGMCEEKLGPGLRLTITSGYRCPTLNSAVGGANNSYHKLALAADVVAVGVLMKPRDLAIGISQTMKEFKYDKLILEFDRWVHVQLPQKDQTPRFQCLTARRELTANGAGKVIYLNGFV